MLATFKPEAAHGSSHKKTNKQKMPEKKASVEGSKIKTRREETKVDVIIGASEFRFVCVFIP